jgi:hypothetical protein
MTSPKYFLKSTIIIHSCDIDDRKTEDHICYNITIEYTNQNLPESGK